MLKQIRKKSDKTYLISADQDAWLANNKDAAHLTPSEFNNEKSKLLERYSENELESRMSQKKSKSLTEEDKQTLLQEFQSLKGTNKFAKIIKK